MYDQTYSAEGARNHAQMKRSGKREKELKLLCGNTVYFYISTRVSKHIMKVLFKLFFFFM